MSEEDKPKTAVEIAMEKLRERGDSPVKSLTDDQKAEIADIRSRYRAKIAEIEIKQEDKMSKAGSYEELEGLREELTLEKKRLEDKMEEEDERVREHQS